MPTFLVTDPVSGKQLTLTGDSPPTEQELEQIFAQQPATQEGILKQDIIPELGGIERFAIGAGKGLEDIGLGTAQVALEGAGFLGADVTEEQEAIRQRVEENQRIFEPLADESTAATVGEFVGEVTASLPVIMIPGAGAATTIPRVAAGVAQGVTAGAVQPTTEEGERGRNILVGGIFGGGATGILGSKTVRSGVSKAYTTILDKLGIRDASQVLPVESVVFEGGQKTLSTQARDQLRNAGVNFDELSGNVKRSLINDVEKARGVPVEQAVRRAQAESLPSEVPLTRGDVAKKFEQVQFESEAAKEAGTEAGQILRANRQSQNQALLDNFRVLEDRIGGTGGKGRSTAEALDAEKNAMRSVVNKAYDEARALGDTGPIVGFDPLRQFLNLPENKLIESGAINTAKRFLTQVDEAGGRGSVNDAEVAIKALNSIFDPVNRAEARLIGQLKDKIDDSVLATGESSAFKEARFTNRLMQTTFKDQRIVKKLVDMASSTDRKVSFENIWDTVVRKSSTEEMKQVLNTLKVGKDTELGERAVKDLQDESLKYIESMALRGGQVGEGGTPIVSGANVARAIDNIGVEKLRTLFSAADADAIINLRDVALNIGKKPVGSVNFSNTSSGVINFLNRFLGNTSLGTTFKQMRNAKVAQQALDVSDKSLKNIRLDEVAGRNAELLGTVFGKAPVAPLTTQAGQGIFNNSRR